MRPSTITPPVWTPLGYERISDLSSAVSLAPPEGARLAVIVCEIQGVRWLPHGDDPDDENGVPLQPGVMLEYDAVLTSLRFIEQASGAILHVAYYR